MIYSMTGYGRASAVCGGREITVEMRSVNARYFEYSSRIPRNCAFLDSRLKALLNSRIARGKVELTLTVQNTEASDMAVAVDMELARSYQQALRDMSESLGVKNDITAGLLARFPTQTYCAVLGLVVASPVAILLRTDMTGVSWVMIVISLVTFALGFAAAMALARGSAATEEPKA